MFLVSRNQISLELYYGSKYVLVKVETFQGFFENLLAKVGDPFLVKIFTAFVTLDVNLICWIGFDKEVEDK